MSVLNKYKINQNFIPNLPKTPFRNGIGKYEGVVMHATAVYNDTVNGERSYETQHWQDAFVNTFTDDTQILQVADFNYICWGTGQTANQMYLSNELCQSHDHSKFLIAYDMWVWLAAYQLLHNKLGVSDNNTLSSHHQCTIRFKEGTHTDPDAYLAEHGKVWKDVVNDVTNYYAQMEKELKTLGGITLEQWKIDMGNQALAALSQYESEGHAFIDVDYWSTKLGEPIPAWMFLELVRRLLVLEGK